jgi:hypothetical protein
VSAATIDKADLKAAFLADAPRAWDKLDSQFANIEARGVETLTHFHEGATLRQSSTERKVLRRHGGYELLSKRQLKENGNFAELVLSMNPDYVFRVSRAADSRTYLLTHFGSYETRFAEVLNEGVMRYLSAPWKIESLPLADLMAARGFTLQDVSVDERNGESLAKVDFEYSPPEDARATIRGGWILMSPQQLWSIRGFQCATTWGTLVGEVEYSGWTDGAPSLRFVSFCYRNTEPVNLEETELRFDFSSFVHREPELTEFKLSAFGLPELPPKGGRDARSTTPWILIVVSVLLALIAFALNSWTRHRRKLHNTVSASV